MAESAQLDHDKEPVSLSRSRNMAAIRGRDTSPELEVRRIPHRHGFRLRLHRRDLPDTVHRSVLGINYVGARLPNWRGAFCLDSVL